MLFNRQFSCSLTVDFLIDYSLKQELNYSIAFQHFLLDLNDLNENSWIYFIHNKVKIHHVCKCSIRQKQLYWHEKFTFLCKSDFLTKLHICSFIHVRNPTSYVAPNFIYSTQWIFLLFPNQKNETLRTNSILHHKKSKILNPFWWGCT